jgi:hypothetical protein
MEFAEGSFLQVIVARREMNTTGSRLRKTWNSSCGRVRMQHDHHHRDECAVALSQWPQPSAG